MTPLRQRGGSGWLTLASPLPADEGPRPRSRRGALAPRRESVERNSYSHSAGSLDSACRGSREEE